MYDSDDQFRGSYRGSDETWKRVRLRLNVVDIVRELRSNLGGGLGIGDDQIGWLGLELPSMDLDAGEEFGYEKSDKQRSFD